jgi:hypothetical protein
MSSETSIRDDDVVVGSVVADMVVVYAGEVNFFVGVPSFVETNDLSQVATHAALFSGVGADVACRFRTLIAETTLTVQIDGGHHLEGGVPQEPLWVEDVEASNDEDVGPVVARILDGRVEAADDALMAISESVRQAYASVDFPVTIPIRFWRLAKMETGTIGVLPGDGADAIRARLYAAREQSISVDAAVAADL